MLWPLLASAASLQKITENFGSNPRNVGFYIYKPDRVQAKPPILVAMHYCTGTAQAFFSGTQYKSLADQYGFIVIYPDSPNSGRCWDVSSTQTLTHNGGGDSLGIVSMVKWTIQRYGADAARVFATGNSSGAMMTNVLIGAYPDVFAAGAAAAGVPYGCFAAGSNNYAAWVSQCSQGNLRHTQAEWAQIVRNGFPGYSGWRPKMSIYHGTNDETLNYANFGEAIKEWTGVFGVSATPTQTIANNPGNGWTKTVYGSKFEAYSLAGGTHGIPTQEGNIIAFFDLKCTSNCFSYGK
ncbi:carbohydrate esterase family 1 protein [Microdochium trichocladiopsis]|uniref:Carboxylic ester hydrolase n=1 Tax=Microdochium trichocladiopsis TaxID=1682393 RepID=A0A9P8Y158_9PEZI|nr:carbohydrate esterase family 1 protein [Microdochium trichocladiopsis]KAH7024922.1 carbohydrate esterase family 1 protein [Microdochium trichocladiopsis]